MRGIACRGQCRAAGRACQVGCERANGVKAINMLQASTLSVGTWHAWSSHADCASDIDPTPDSQPVSNDCRRGWRSRVARAVRGSRSEIRRALPLPSCLAQCSRWKWRRPRQRRFRTRYKPPCVGCCQCQAFRPVMLRPRTLTALHGFQCRAATMYR